MQHRFGEAGLAGDAHATFAALADSDRYGPDTLARLARFVAARLGGNRDEPLYWLCHLVRALDAMGTHPMAFLMGGRHAAARLFRQALPEAGGEAVEIGEKGLVIAYPEREVTVYYSEMPFLAGIYELLCMMEGCAHFAEIEGTLNELCATTLSLGAVDTATRALATIMRAYRSAHLDHVRQEARYQPIASFLGVRDKLGDWSRIDDEDILDFWLAHADEGSFREYRTVFRSWHAWVESAQVLAAEKAAAAADPIGGDREAGEWEIDADDIAQSDDDWQDPLAAFEGEPLAGIKFFKAKSERAPLATLMQYGPSAIRWFRAYLRLEAFGPEQLGISQFLRTGRGERPLSDRFVCNDAQSYEELCEALGRLSDHVRRLSLAAAHAVGLSDSEDFESAFRGMRRAGFDGAQGENFLAAVEPLVAIAGKLQEASRRADRLAAAPGLGPAFAADRETFSRQFTTLYGEPS